jgi:hypothetical protein
MEIIDEMTYRSTGRKVNQDDDMVICKITMTLLEYREFKSKILSSDLSKESK